MRLGYGEENAGWVDPVGNQKRRVFPITFYTSLYVTITPVCPTAVQSLRSHALILPHPVCPARRLHAAGSTPENDGLPGDGQKKSSPDDELLLSPPGGILRQRLEEERWRQPSGW